MCSTSNNIIRFRSKPKIGETTFSINLNKYAFNHLIKMLHVMFNHLERTESQRAREKVDDDNSSIRKGKINLASRCGRELGMFAIRQGQR